MMTNIGNDDNDGNDGNDDNDLGAAGGGGEDDALPRGDAHQGDGTAPGHCSHILVLKSPHTTNLIIYIAPHSISVKLFKASSKS